MATWEGKISKKVLMTIDKINSCMFMHCGYAKSSILKDKEVCRWNYY